MGASDFTVKAKGTNALMAFEIAVEEARYEYGHGGYSGSVAEKGEFKMVGIKPSETPDQAVDRCMSDDDHFCQEKWGPAGCVSVGNGEFIFFGWASS